MKIDAVEHDVEILAVAFDFGVGFPLHRGLDREFVQAELVAHDDRIGRRRLRHIRPHHDPAVRRQPGRVETVHHCGATVSVDEVANQSPTLTLRAACAAARRATGTRYGEQLT